MILELSSRDNCMHALLNIHMCSVVFIQLLDKNDISPVAFIQVAT